MLWQRHEKLILGVFIRALKMLCSEKNLPDAENRINETLYIKAKHVYLKLPSKQRPAFFGLFLEPQNQPQTECDVGEKFLLKRPDFKWRLENKSDSNPHTAIRDYDIECKRLGKRLNKKWVLNENYVHNGILRFLNIEHNYGRGMPFGAMIGYVQNMELKDILKEINKYINRNQKHKIAPVKFPQKNIGSKEVIKTTQKLYRTEINPASFNLRHIWGDLRKTGTSSAKMLNSFLLNRFSSDIVVLCKN